MIPRSSRSSGVGHRGGRSLAGGRLGRGGSSRRSTCPGALINLREAYALVHRFNEQQLLGKHRHRGDGHQSNQQKHHLHKSAALSEQTASSDSTSSSPSSDSSSSPKLDNLDVHNNNTKPQTSNNRTRIRALLTRLGISPDTEQKQDDAITTTTTTTTTTTKDDDSDESDATMLWTAEDADALFALYTNGTVADDDEDDGGETTVATNNISTSKTQQQEFLDISEYLQKIPTKELRQLRMLATMCNMVYYLRDIPVHHALRRRFGLTLVTSSFEEAEKAKEDMKDKEVVDADVYGDLARVDGVDDPGSPRRFKAAEFDLVRNSGAVLADEPLSSSEEDLNVSSSSTASTTTTTTSSSSNQDEAKPTTRSSIFQHAVKGGGAAVATITAVMSTVSGAAPVAARAAARVVSEAAESLASSDEGTTAHDIAQAIDDTLNSEPAGDDGNNASSSSSASTTAASSPPIVEWFIADDEKTATRYIVIEGSNNAASWRTNVAFDPVDFEDPSLNVRVHRGMYEESLSMYATLLPFIEEHFKNHPPGTAHLCLTGHSLGGSLATLVSLMLHYRGVLPTGAQRPVCTFGAASVFCDSEACKNGACDMAMDMPSSKSTLPFVTTHDTFRTRSSVLAKLKLPPNHVRNVMMHLDIVPRAFTCDYSLVANVLQTVNPTAFKDHGCLHGAERSVMYLPCGETLVLQPGEEHRFNISPSHPMLPKGVGCWLLAEPSGHLATQVRQTLTPDEEEAAGARPKAANVMEAYFALLNTPHPLETLGDPSAYGPDGLISRYHNPFHYALSIAGLLRKRRNMWRVSIAVNAERSMRNWTRNVEEEMRRLIIAENDEDVPPRRRHITAEDI